MVWRVHVDRISGPNMSHTPLDNNRWVEEVLKDRDIALIGFADR
mgnify:CR=1 FL=1